MGFIWRAEEAQKNSCAGAHLGGGDFVLTAAAISWCNFTGDQCPDLCRQFFRSIIPQVREGAVNAFKCETMRKNDSLKGRIGEILLKLMKKRLNIC